MLRGFPPVIAVLVVVLGIAIAGGAVAAGGTTPVLAGQGTTGDGPATLDRPDPASVIRINMTASGDARWTVASRFSLGDDEERASFRAFAADVENGSVDAGYSVDTFRAFADRAEELTARDEEMAIRSANWSHRVEDDVGTIALSFTWTNFAETEGNRVVLGDAFGTENDTWFPALGADQRLVINAPPEFAVEESAFPFSDGSITIDGPAEVDIEKFPVVYVPIADPPNGNGTTPPTSPPPTDPPQDEEGFPLAILGGAVVLAAAILAAAYLIAEREPEGPSADGGVADANPGTDADEAADGATAGAGTAQSTASPATGEATNGDDAIEAVEPEEGEADEEIDEELLSDEERVERLLEENGGRMKQADIVTETGWSNAKVSQLLSAMADDERVQKLRIGRENLIALPDEDVGEID